MIVSKHNKPTMYRVDFLAFISGVFGKLSFLDFRISINSLTNVFQLIINNYIIQQTNMEEYRLQYDQDYQAQDINDAALEHYRIQINKLEERLVDEAATYKKRIAQLESELYANRKPIMNSTQKKPIVKTAENLSYELYEKDLVIRQLKAENVKLRQIINNPDKVLIRKPDHFQALTEKEQEIIRLRKTIQQLEGKHDGQFLSEHKLKKQNEMLLHEVDQLRLELRNQNKHRMGFNEDMLDPQLLEAIRYKKELQACKKQLVVYENALKTKQQQLQILRERLIKKNAGLGVFTQLEEIQLQLREFKEKNKDLNKVVIQLQEENQKLIKQRDRARIAAQQQVPEVARKVITKTEQEEKLIRYYQTKSVAMKSLVPPPNEAPTTMRKTARYDQFQFSDWESIA